MFEQDDETGGELLVPCFSAWSECGSGAAQAAKVDEAGLPAPGWKWNGEEWEYSSRHLNEPHLQAVS